MVLPDLLAPRVLPEWEQQDLQVHKELQDSVLLDLLAPRVLPVLEQLDLQVHKELQDSVLLDLLAPRVLPEWELPDQQDLLVLMELPVLRGRRAQLVLVLLDRLDPRVLQV